MRAITPSISAIARFSFGLPEPLMSENAALRVAEPKKFTMIGTVSTLAAVSTLASFVKALYTASGHSTMMSVNTAASPRPTASTVARI